jgi:1-deoxy-D-xylulose-5-phosphate synthase
MFTAQLDSNSSPFVIRYPRGEGVMTDWQTPFEEIEIGKGRKLRNGKELAILSFGHPGNFVKKAIGELNMMGIYPGHYDMRFAKPIDEELLHEVFTQYDKIVTVEDGTIIGGFGSAVLEFMALHGYKANVKMLGIPDRLVEHGTLKELHAECGYDAAGIVETVKHLMADRVKTSVDFSIAG